jgi:DNA-binding PadR family transcriptional regulator
MTLGMLEHHVMMATLAQHPEAYGISIQEYIRQRTGNTCSHGSIYAALARLSDKGYLKSRYGEVTRKPGGRAKLYWTVTAPGKAALKASLQAINSLEV